VKWQKSMGKVDPELLPVLNLTVHRLVYLETSAATGQNVSRSVETLLEKVMIRMETAVDRAMLPGRRGRPRDLNDPDLTAPAAHNCTC
jgi:Ras-related protein Rab-27A